MTFEYTTDVEPYAGRINARERKHLRQWLMSHAKEKASGSQCADFHKTNLAFLNWAFGAACEPGWPVLNPIENKEAF